MSAQITQLDLMRTGARILTAGAIATAGLAAAKLVLVPGQRGQDTLPAFNLAAIMATAAVAVQCHRSTQRLLSKCDEQIEDRVHHVEEVQERILGAAVDELANRRQLHGL